MTNILCRNDGISNVMMHTEQISQMISKSIKRFASHCRMNLGAK